MWRSLGKRMHIVTKIIIRPMHLANCRLATGPTSGPVVSAVPEASIPTHDLQAMGWRRKFQGLLTESQAKAGDEEPVAPAKPMPKGLLSDLGRSAVRRVVSAR